MRIPLQRFHVVPNGASLPPASDPPPTVDPNLIVSVGRLEHYKGHHRAILAMHKLLEHLPQTRLEVVGSGPYESELRRLVRLLRLQDHDISAGSPSSHRQDLTDLFCSARLVLLLSDYEAHPISVMEALSVGRPVLVADTSGLRELAQKRMVPLNPAKRWPRRNSQSHRSGTDQRFATKPMSPFRIGRIAPTSFSRFTRCV